MRRRITLPDTLRFAGLACSSSGRHRPCWLGPGAMVSDGRRLTHHPFACFRRRQSDLACASASPRPDWRLAESIGVDARPGVADRHDRAGPRGERRRLKAPGRAPLLQIRPPLLRFCPLQHTPAALRCPRLPAPNDPASAFSRLIRPRCCGPSIGTSPVRFYAVAENKRRCSQDGCDSRVSLAAFIGCGRVMTAMK
jgi:hypothetical protein